MEPVCEIRTERLRLHRWGKPERAALARISGDPRVMRFFPSTHDRARVDALVDRVETCFEERGWGLWSVTPDAVGSPVGFVGLLPIDHAIPGQGGVEVGWRLDAAVWGRGYATEAGRAALRVAFDLAGLVEVWSVTAVSNEPSRAVMHRLGLREHSRFDAPDIPPGHPLRPHVAYRIDAERWRAG